MIRTFEEWFRQSEFYERVFPAMALEIGIQVWHARDAEIADLKRQLRQALAQVEIVDRALGDPGNTSSKVALDACVQEKVDRALALTPELVEDIHAAVAQGWCVPPNTSKAVDVGLAIAITNRVLAVLRERAANRAKVKL